AAMLAGVEDCPQRVRGCVCVGYPLHPPSQPDKLRLAPLLEARRPVLVCQGERDVFGTRAEIETMDWPEHMSWQFLADGSHDLGPTGRSEATLKGNIDRAAKAVRAFMASQPLR
ncbi:MAG: alpha/beta hydrolase, partial [Hyphomicrobiaceae bacterium]|nr:alpha/beta hydrolase [Hyphomicrobiaceae bacterium]